MDRPPEPDLVKVTEIFLVPSTFLVAALGAADTNPHRAMISLFGVIISTLWWVCSHEAFVEHTSAKFDPLKDIPQRRTRLLSWLSMIFVAGWLLSTIIHVLLWQRPLGG